MINICFERAPVVVAGKKQRIYKKLSCNLASGWAYVKAGEDIDGCRDKVRTRLYGNTEEQREKPSDDVNDVLRRAKCGVMCGVAIRRRNR